MNYYFIAVHIHRYSIGVTDLPARIMMRNMAINEHPILFIIQKNKEHSGEEWTLLNWKEISEDEFHYYKDELYVD